MDTRHSHAADASTDLSTPLSVMDMTETSRFNFRKSNVLAGNNDWSFSHSVCVLFATVACGMWKISRQTNECA